MGWISKINSLFWTTGLSQTGASLFTFFSVVILFCNIVLSLQILYLKKKIDSATKSFLSFVGPWLFGFNVYTGTDDILLCHESLIGSS